ncbi:hypothetical protein [Nonomuraea sp. NPDC046570]|uniref:hypothetical protein n=1 Tax=Nonomuraea sp. NPDC046570 TaxID=3155255 RepID=UPI0033D8DEEB
MAALLAGLHLLFMVIAAVCSLLDDAPSLIWWGLLGLPTWGSTLVPVSQAWLVFLGLALAAGLRTWMLWEVLRGPALPATRPSERRIVWLRRYLYLNVAFDLILWSLISNVPDAVYAVTLLVIWAPLIVLFVLVPVGVSARFRAVAIAFGLINLVVSAASFFGSTWLSDEGAFAAGLAALVWQAMVLVAQRRDGRWSRATVRIGWWAFGLTLVIEVVDLIPGTHMALSLLGSLHVFGVWWYARSAHELAEPGAAAVPAGEWPRLLRPAGAAVTVGLLLALVHSEDMPSLSFSGEDMGCYDWTIEYRRFGDTRPQDRERAFLCWARSVEDGSPMFDDDVADQRILAWGRAVCAASDDPQRKRALVEGVDTSRLSEALVFLCPEVVGRQEPERLRSQAQVRQDFVDYHSKMTSYCSDPWARLRARRQGTVARFLSESGGYYVYDDKSTAKSDDHADLESAFDDGLVHAAGTSAVVLTGEEYAICVTVKAFGAAPPLRLKGWDQVTEVGIRSRSGRLVLPPNQEDGEEPTAPALPNMAADGPGHYRLRVYTREMDPRDDDGPYTEHLIVAFPGRSKKVVHHVRP